MSKRAKRKVRGEREIDRCRSGMNALLIVDKSYLPLDLL